jgi:hypothetical protein
MVEMCYVQSSNIEAIGYDETSQELHVRFLKSGKTYVYPGVPQDIFAAFSTASSQGTFFGQFIRPVYTNFYII